jgi:hypothetical protein
MSSAVEPNDNRASILVTSQDFGSTAACKMTRGIRWKVWGYSHGEAMNDRVNKWTIPGGFRPPGRTDRRVAREFILLKLADNTVVRYCVENTWGG